MPSESQVATLSAPVKPVEQLEQLREMAHSLAETYAPPPTGPAIFDGEAAVELPEWTVSLPAFPMLTRSIRAETREDAIAEFYRQCGILNAERAAEATPAGSKVRPAGKLAGEKREGEPLPE